MGGGVWRDLILGSALLRLDGGGLRFNAALSLVGLDLLGVFALLDVRHRFVCPIPLAQPEQSTHRRASGHEASARGVWKDTARGVRKTRREGCGKTRREGCGKTRMTEPCKGRGRREAFVRVYARPRCTRRQDALARGMAGQCARHAACTPGAMLPWARGGGGPGAKMRQTRALPRPFLWRRGVGVGAADTELLTVAHGQGGRRTEHHSVDTRRAGRP